MNRIIKWSILASTVFLIAGRAAAQDAYNIQGKLTGISNGQVKLVAISDPTRTEKDVDSGAVVNGLFELKGVISGAQVMKIIILPGNWQFNIFVENKALGVNADTTGATHYDYTKYGEGKFSIIKSYNETGSRNFDDWQQFEKDPGQKQYDQVFAKLEKQFDAAGSDVDAQYKVRDKLDSVENLLHEWQRLRIERYINQYPSSPAGVYMFSELYKWVMGKMPYTRLDSTINLFSGEATLTPYYKNLMHYRQLLKNVQVGSEAPDFILQQRDSSKLALSSLRGNYVMIDFWASWCHPCRQAIPHWKTVYQQYHKDGLEILSISDDKNWKDWKSAMDQEQMPWAQVVDYYPVKYLPAAVGSLYMVTYIPFYILLDKQGKILMYTGEETKIDDKLKELFKN